MKKIFLTLLVFISSAVYAQQNNAVGAKKIYYGYVYLEPEKKCELKINSYWVKSTNKNTITRLDVTFDSPIGRKSKTIELFQNYPVGNSDETTFTTLPKKFFNWGEARKTTHMYTFGSFEIKLDKMQKVISYKFEPSLLQSKKLSSPNDYRYSCVFE